MRFHTPPTPCSPHTHPPTHPPTPQTSLARFVELYELAIDHSERAVLPAKRIHNILEHMTCAWGGRLGS